MTLSVTTVQATVTAANLAGKQVTATCTGLRYPVGGPFTSKVSGTLRYTGTARIVGDVLLLFSYLMRPEVPAAMGPVDISLTAPQPVQPYQGIDRLNPGRQEVPIPYPGGGLLIVEPGDDPLAGEPFRYPSADVIARTHAENFGVFNWPADPDDATHLAYYQDGGGATLEVLGSMTFPSTQLTGISQSTYNAHAHIGKVKTANGGWVEDPGWHLGNGIYA
jgi:hypothetical protein